MNRYRVLLPLTVHTEDGAYTQGEEFEKDFTADEEEANVKSGLLEIVPRQYRVIGDSKVYGVAKGDPDPTFTAGLPIGNEAQLIAGGHIERVEDTKSSKSKSKKEAKS